MKKIKIIEIFVWTIETSKGYKIVTSPDYPPCLARGLKIKPGELVDEKGNCLYPLEPVDQEGQKIYATREDAIKDIKKELALEYKAVLKRVSSLLWRCKLGEIIIEDDKVQRVRFRGQLYLIQQK